MIISVYHFITKSYTQHFLVTNVLHRSLCNPAVDISTNSHKTTPFSVETVSSVL
jgi:hypothetical protein